MLLQADLFVQMAAVCKNNAIAYFGLMHMVATNMCVWLNVIIEETKHEILQFLDHNSTSRNYYILLFVFICKSISL